MSYANLGVHIALEDAASSGLDALGLGFMNLHNIIGNLALVGMSKLSGGMKGLLSTSIITGAAFEGLAGFLVETVQAAGDLEQEVANLRASVNGADEVTQEMSDTLINLADNSIYTTAVVADGFTTLGVDGWNARQILDGMGQSMIYLAEATRSDMVPAANLLGTSMETYGAAANEATQYTNDLTFMFYNGEKSVANIQSALNQAAGTAHVAQVSFGELSDALALLGEMGLKGSQGGSALRYMLTALISPTNKAAKELAQLGVVVMNETNPALLELEGKLSRSGNAGQKVVSQFDGTVTTLQAMYTEAQKLGLVHTDQTMMQWAISTGVLTNKLYDAQGNFLGLRNMIDVLGQSLDNLNPQQKSIALQQLFNVRGAQAATRFLNDYADTLKRFDTLDGIRKQTDATEKARIATSTLNGAIKELSSTWTDTMARLGTADLGPVKNALMGVWSLLHNFNTAGPDVQRNVAMILLALTGFTGIAFIVSTVAFAFFFFGTALATVAPIVAGVVGAIASIAAVSAGLVYVWQQAEEGKGKFAALKPVVDAIKGTFEAFGNFIKTEVVPTFSKLAPLLGLWKLALIPIAIALSPIILLIGAVVGAVMLLTVIITKAVQIAFWFAGVWQSAQQGMVNFIGAIRGAVKSGFDTITGIIHGAVNLVVGLFKWLYDHNYYFRALVDTIMYDITQVRNTITNVLHMIQSVWNTVWGAVSSRLSAIWSGIVSTIQHFLGAGKQKFEDFKSQITHVVQSLGTTLLNSGKNMINMLIDGIKSRFGALLSVVGDIGKTIAGMLGFHSPPKEGPLADSDQYMPNMMKMYQRGIHDHIPLVEEATGRVAKAMTMPKDLKPTVSTSRVGDIQSSQLAFASAVHSASVANSQGSGDIHIYIDGQEVTGSVMKRVTGDLRRNGVGRTMR
jgi:hypothetical protein